mmetsp:Transcript_14116/g.34992  ORF Transcript_14116/g.34992 Transcript_14116/m.34992 type:complete len:397 (+) Transcript_14116:330-1520(+)
MVPKAEKRIRLRIPRLDVRAEPVRGYDTSAQRCLLKERYLSHTYQFVPCAKKKWLPFGHYPFRIRFFYVCNKRCYEFSIIYTTNNRRTTTRSRTTDNLLALLQSAVQRLDQVVGVLDSARHPDEPVCNSHLQSVLLDHVRVGHYRTRREDRLRGTEILAQGPGALDFVHQFHGVAGHLEPQHGTMNSVLVVLVGERFLRMLRARICHRSHLRVRLQPLRDFGSGFALSPDAQVHGLHGLQDRERHLRGHDVSVHVLAEFDRLEEFLRLGHDRATRPDVVPVVELGQRLHRQIAAPVQGFQHHWRRERRVATVQRPELVGDLRHLLQIHQPQHGVGRRLGPHQFGVGPHRLANRLVVLEIHERKLNAVLLELDTTQPVGTTVRAIGDHAVVTFLQEG